MNADISDPYSLECLYFLYTKDFYKNISYLLTKYFNGAILTM